MDEFGGEGGSPRRGRSSSSDEEDHHEDEDVLEEEHQHQHQQHHEGYGDDVIWSSVPEEKRPLFFKIIHAAVIRDQQLMIPVKFVGKIGRNELSDVAVIKIPTGKIWKVELIRRPNGCIYFHSGLQEFIEFNSISPGHFLVFRYDGNSEFYVLIFDMSGGEINYPVSSCISSDHSDEEESTHNSGSPYAENAEDIEKDYMEVSDGDDSSFTEEVVVEEEEEDVSDNEAVVKDSASKKATVRKKRSQKTKENYVRGAQVANEFKSKYPFFTVTTQPAYLNHKYMPIPCTFDRKHLPENLESVRLKISDGRSWVVKLLISEKKEIRLSRGISAFYNSNKLEEGDVCVFEVVKKRYLVLRVHIFRRDTVDNATSSSNPPAAMLTNENPK